MDLRTLLLAQTCALATTAGLLWVARGEVDQRNGMRSWTIAITSQAIAYFVLSHTPSWPAVATAVVGNFAGACGVALFFVAIREFVGLHTNPRGLVALVVGVTIAAGVAGERYTVATIINGFVYAGFQWLNARTLWRPALPELRVTQRVVAVFYVAMGIVLPVRAAALLVIDAHLHYLDMPSAWQDSVFLFGFVYVVVTNLGFVLMCKVRAEAEARAQARTDPLTQLPNRRALDEAIALALVAAERTARPFAIVMVDVDRFKAMNDTHGHAAGDVILASFARRLGDGLRGVDRAFRYGGEEFCLLLPDTDVPGAHALAERARARVALPGDPSGPAVTASFGVTAWRPGDAVDALFGRADRALYRAKRSGRDRVEVESD